MEQVYSVTQVNLYIKNMFQRDYALNNIYVKGEVSNCKYHTSGHIYFTVKDGKGQMACVMFAGQRSGLKFRLEEGQNVIILGNISVYERDGKYQLYAREIIPDGSGILYQRYEQLKNKLQEEGLFDEKHKKKIPVYAHRIGIVTAKTGAAIQDIINIAARRNPYVQLYLYPALVQGDGAAVSIAEGIRYLDSIQVDIIIVGRGGGSIEDLWAFNEEIVVRTVYECNTPIISAVGHETDTTIVDFVSDLRAPTPSAAAELSVFDYKEFLEKIYSYKNLLFTGIVRRLNNTKNYMEVLKIKLDYLNPSYQLSQKRQQLMDIEDKLDALIKLRIKEKRHKLAVASEKLLGLSPLKKMNQGYAFVIGSNGKTVRSIAGIEKGDYLKINVTDGEITAMVEDINRRNK